MREFDSRVYLGTRFLAKRRTVLLGHKSGVHQQMFQQDLPIVYLSKGLHQDAVELYKKIHRFGGSVVGLDEENFLRFQDTMAEKTMRIRYDPRAVEHTDLIFVWGRTPREMVVKYRSEFDPDKIVVVGNARFDIRKPAYNAAYKRVMKKRGIAGKHILVMTSFVVGNNQLGNALTQALFEDRYGTENTEDYIHLRYHYEKLIIEHFIVAVRQLARTYPDTPIIFRPHPIERIDVYEAAFAEISNIIIRRDGLPHEWIVDCLCIVHHGTTAVFEATFNGKPAICYCPLIDPDIKSDMTVQISSAAKTADELCGQVGACIANAGTGDREMDPKIAAMIKPYIANTDFNGADRIVEEIETRRMLWFKDINPAPPAEAAEIASTGSRQIQGGRLDRLRRRFFMTGKEKRYQEYRRSKFEGIALDEIDTLIGCFREIDNTIPEVNIKQVAPSTFLLTPE